MNRKKKKKNALVVCQNGGRFWTTQEQFWKWVRRRIVIKLADSPLTGQAVRSNKELELNLDKAVYNLNHSNQICGEDRNSARLN